MKGTTVKWLSILTVSSILVGCQAADSKEEMTSSEALTTTLDDDSHSHESEHNHVHDEEVEKIHAGYFEDSQIHERLLSDWKGDWQSVYPYLLDGTLDEVFAHKEKQKGDKTAEEFKAYYDVGYKTDTERIIIQGNKVTFFNNGESYTGEYQSDRYEILTYEAGNKGVRYIFKLVAPTKEMPQYIQFSDHSISANNADHYHLYWGDDRKALLEEVINWPTFYPSELDGHTIAHEMMEH